MMAKKAHPAARCGEQPLQQRFARLVGQAPARFDASARKMPLLHRFAGRNAIEAPDPVLLAIFAIDRVGPAAVRACASGVEVCVAAPDEATARYFAPRWPKRRDGAAPIG